MRPTKKRPIDAPAVRRAVIVTSALALGACAAPMVDADAQDSAAIDGRAPAQDSATIDGGEPAQDSAVADRVAIDARSEADASPSSDASVARDVIEGDVVVEDRPSPPGDSGVGPQRCSMGAECGSGFCVDGFCCDARCDGACVACDGASTGGADGRCLPVRSGTDPANECAADTAMCRTGVCDGRGACGAAADGVLCRASVGACDAAEVCAAGACPANSVAPAGTVCRPAAGTCDRAEVCNGTAANCPADTLVAAIEVVACRPATGPCDRAELCNGSSVDCPVDAMVPAGQTCRAAAGPCDVAEACNGSSAACPADALQPMGAVCRAAAGPCDVAETCSGATSSCPANAFAPSTSSVCLPYACTGSTAPCTTSCTVNSDCGPSPAAVCVAGRCFVGKRVFITSSTYVTATSLGGVTGADGRCQMAATAAGLSGTFRAWLSTTASPVATRFVRASVPYIVPDAARRVIAANWTALTTSGPFFLPMVFENGAAITGFSFQMYSGSNADGTVASANCNEFTSDAAQGIMGTYNPTTGFFSLSHTQLGCTSFSPPRRLLCVEQ